MVECNNNYHRFSNFSDGRSYISSSPFGTIVNKLDRVIQLDNKQCKQSRWLDIPVKFQSFIGFKFISLFNNDYH